MKIKEGINFVKKIIETYAVNFDPKIINPEEILKRLK